MQTEIAAGGVAGGSAAVKGQHAADAELVAKIKSDNFQGPPWDLLQDRLARYGLAIITSWLRSGEIYAKCRNQGIGGVGPGWEEEVRREAEDIVQETVARALHKFEGRLRTKGWRADGGASLSTSFVTCCLYQYRDVYRHWVTVWKRDRETEAQILDQPAVTVVDPAENVVDDEAYRQTMTQLSDGDFLCLPLKASGHSHAEIGAKVGISVRAVEGRIRREKKKMKELRGDQSEDGGFRG